MARRKIEVLLFDISEEAESELFSRIADLVHENEANGHAICSAHDWPVDESCACCGAPLGLARPPYCQACHDQGCP